MDRPLQRWSQELRLYPVLILKHGLQVIPPIFRIFELRGHLKIVPVTSGSTENRWMVTRLNMELCYMRVTWGQWLSVISMPEAIHIISMFSPSNWSQGLLLMAAVVAVVVVVVATSMWPRIITCLATGMTPWKVLGVSGINPRDSLGRWCYIAID